MAAKRIAAALAASAVLAQPLPALAQAQQCLTEREVSAIAIYSMPSLVQGVRLRCAGQLTASGYIARGGDALSARYTALQDRAWPIAKSALLRVFIGAPDSAPAELNAIAGAPDKDIRPLVDALITQEIQPRIALGNCSNVERVLQMMAGIEPESAGSLLGLLGGFSGLVDAQRLPVCPRQL